MNIRRYFGRTNRDALAAMRKELGPEAVVLRNHAVDGGVELLAMPADALPPDEALPPRRSATPAAGTGGGSAPAMAPATTARSAGPAPRGALATGAPDEAKAESAAAAAPEMSTLSFQQYVRERLARRAAAQAEAPGVSASAAPVAEVSSAVASVEEAPAAAALAATPVAAAPSPAPASSDSPAVLAELRELRRFVSEQLGALAWMDGARRSVPHARLLSWLLGAGFSPALVRVVLSRLPADWRHEQAVGWVRRALAHNLICDAQASPLECGGVYALVGPTGVGKTTTTAKLAARFALVHGVASVGLITVDAYRIGGRDQLRSFGRMLGVPVHVAHDAETLADLLRLFSGRKLVLIDTAGLGQRDQRVEQLLRSVSAPSVRRLVVLNATAQAETLDDVACAYRAQAAAGVILTKVDEAARLGGVLDCALRHRLRIVGVADGQRVPEDWRAPDAHALVAQALSPLVAPVFDLESQEAAARMAADAVPGFDV